MSKVESDVAPGGDGGRPGVALHRGNGEDGPRIHALEAELAEARGQQLATAEVLKTISRSTFDLEAVLQTMTESAAHLAEADMAAILRLHGDSYRYVTQFRIPPDVFEYFKALPLTAGRGSCVGRVLLERTVVHIPDALADPEFTFREAQRRGGFRTMLGVPLLRDGEPIGVILLWRSAVKPFTARQIDLIATFADQAVIAIENARLFQEVQEALEQQSATGEILRIISRSPTDAQSVFDTIARNAARLCHAEFCHVFRYDGAIVEFVAHRYENLPPGAEEAVATAHRFFPMAPDRGSTAGRTLLTGLPAEIADVLADPDYALNAVAKLLGYRSIVGVPMLREGVAIGAITVMRTRTGTFAPNQIELLKTFADQAVIAIENARLFEAEQARTREVEEALDYQTATSDILRVISRSPTDVQPVFETIAESVARLCQVQFCQVFRFDGELIHFAAHHGLSPEAVDDIRQTYPMPPGRVSATARAMLNGAVEQIPDVRSDEDYARGKLASLMSYRSIVAVPILKQGRPIGAIAVARSQTGHFPERQIELIQTFADQAVIAIENARLFEAEQARTREIEEALEFQTATSEVLGVISRSPSELQPVLDAIVSTAARLCNASYATAFGLKDGEFRLIASDNADSDFVKYLMEHPPPIDRSTLAGRVALERRTVHLPDCLADPEYTVRQHQGIGKYRTMLGVPLLREGETIGVICLLRPVVAPFIDRQIGLVETFADQAVIAIENARLFEEVQSRTREIEQALARETATADVLKVISRSRFDLRKVLDVLLETAVRLVDGDGGTITRQVGGEFVRATGFGISEAFRRVVYESPVARDRSTITGRVLLEGCVVHIPDVRVDPDYDWTELVEDVGIRTLLGVPLMREGTPIGVISVVRQKVQPFTDKQIELIQTFADQAVIAIENTRLFEADQARTRELEEALEFQTATSEVLAIISRSPSELQPVLQAIVSTAVRLCQAEYALAFQLRDGVYRLVATDQVDSAFAEYAEQNPIPLGQGSLTGRAGLEKRTIHLPDCLADPEYELHGHQQIGQFRTGLGVPLLHEDGPVGVITLLRTRVEPFTNRQIELVETFADQALIAIKNARLFEEVQARTSELQEALDYQTATSEVLGVISRSTLDLQPVLEVVIESATRLCGATRGQIFRFDVERDVLLLAAAHGAWPGFVEYLEKNPTRPGPGSISGMAAAQRRTVHIPDALELEGYEHKELLRAQEFRTALAVPIQREDALLGVMVVLKSHVEPFTVRQIELVETFADQAVIAIENARLFEEVQARTSDLGRSLAELRALAEVGRTVSSSLDLPTVLGAILQHACEISNTGGGAIYVLDADAGELTLEAGYNMSEELIEAVRNYRIRLGDTVVGECAQKGAPIEVPDIDLADDYPLFEILRQSGIKALLAVPLTHQGASIGVLLVRRRRTGAFDAGTVSLLQAFASQSSIAINNARLFHEIEEKRRQIEIASQHKSQFLANMSHELRTPLNAILGYTELMQDGVYGELPEKVVNVIERVQTNGRHLLGLINDVLDLSKIEAGQLVLRLEDYALSDVVQTVATASEPLAREKKLDFKIEIAGDMPRGRGDERRIAQVLLNLVGNAIKFTDQGGVRVKARAKKSKFVVTVADTGPGIAASEQARIFDEFQQVDSSNTKTKSGTGLGLAISRRIVEMHGGRISVHSEPGEGAVFRVDLPIRVERQRSL